MSTLVMALVAGLALGSGPKAVSAEMEQGLDLSGTWEGTCYRPWAKDSLPGRLVLRDADWWGLAVLHLDLGPGLAERVFFGPLTDEGGGQLRSAGAGPGRFLGTYKREGDRLIIHISHDAVDYVLTLRRVK